MAGSSLVFLSLALVETIDSHLYCASLLQKLCLISGQTRRCFPGGDPRPTPQGRHLSLEHLPQPLAMSLGSEQSDIFIPSFVCQGRTSALCCGPFEREFIPLRGHNLMEATALAGSSRAGCAPWDTRPVRAACGESCGMPSPVL